MHEPDAERRYDSRRGLGELWAGVTLGPLGWALHLSVNYALADSACDNPWNILFLSITLVCIAIALWGGWFAWRSYNLTGREWPSGDADGVLIRSRFMAVSGLLLTALTLLLILTQTIPMLMLKPCT
jgi:hypothetical protein